MCITPLSLKNPKTNQSFPINCGKCPDCIARRTSQWSFRLQKEAEVSTSAFFLTLTYNSECIPLTNRGFPTLEPQHVTLFLKRLRKKNKGTKIKYYYVGEYGSKTQRPHYHMLLFNANMEDIESTWNYGKVHYGKVSGASIGYTLKYMVKDPSIKKHPGNNRINEFGRMSKGLGLAYLTSQIIQYHKQKHHLLERINVQIDGKRISMPRYYKERIYSEQEKLIIKMEAIKLEAQRWLDENKIDIPRQIEAHKAKFTKMEKSKEKNKYL